MAPRRRSQPDSTLPETAVSAAAIASPVRVAFQGERGAFSEDAIAQLWGEAAEPVPVRTFQAVMEAVEESDADFGLLPIESTLAGGVDSAYDLVAYHDQLSIVAETVVPIHLALLGLQGATIAKIETLSSHPLLLSQCGHFLGSHRHIRAEPAWDTAGAAREVAERGDPRCAAAGSARAADYYGLAIIRARIEDRIDAQMRFVAVGREPAAVPEGTPSRTALLCVFADSAGALIAGLRPLADAGLNIGHLASRPTREPWRYQFFLEVEHLAGDPAALAAISALRRASRECRVLGTYARWPSHATDADASGAP